MCNYKGLRLKGFAEQKSATHLTLQYIIMYRMYRICFYYEMLYKLMQFSYDGGQKHQKYEIHFELSIVCYPYPLSMSQQAWLQYMPMQWM